MTRTDYYRAVLLGIVIGMAFITAFSVFTQEDELEAPKSNFEVVDTYKGCDVVRWTGTHNLATYKYFLNCKND
jgi:hypothetical protein